MEFLLTPLRQTWPRSRKDYELEREREIERDFVCRKCVTEWKRENEIRNYAIKKKKKRSCNDLRNLPFVCVQIIKRVSTRRSLGIYVHRIGHYFCNEYFSSTLYNQKRKKKTEEIKTKIIIIWICENLSFLSPFERRIKILPNSLSSSVGLKWNHVYKGNVCPLFLGILRPYMLRLLTREHGFKMISSYRSSIVKIKKRKEGGLEKKRKRKRRCRSHAEPS